VFANVLDAPVAKLAMGDDVDVVENFVDARTLLEDMSVRSHGNAS